MSETETLRLSDQTLAEIELGRQRVLEAEKRIAETRAASNALPEPEPGIEIVEMKPKRSRGVKLERVDVPPPAPTPVVPPASEPDPEPPAEGPTAADPLDQLLSG